LILGQFVIREPLRPTSRNSFDGLSIVQENGWLRLVRSERLRMRFGIEIFRDWHRKKVLSGPGQR